jgi:DNA polymerase-1
MGAKGSGRLGKQGRVFEIQSGQLEERWEIPFKVIGYPEWFANSFEEGAVLETEKVIVRHGHEEEDLKASKAWLRIQKALGVDTETTGADKRSGLDPWREGSRLLLMQMGTLKGVYLIDPALVEFFKDILESTEILHLGHNLVYDFKYIFTKYKIHMENLYDTMLGEQLLTSGLYGLSVSLAAVARRCPPFRLISKDTRKDFIEFKERGEKFSREMLYYAARDINLLFPIMEFQEADLLKKNMRVVAQDEFDIIPVTAMMEIGGVFINRDTLNRSLKYWHARRDELEKQILNIYDQEMSKQGHKRLSLLPEYKEVFDLDSQAQKLAALREIGFDIEDVKRDTLEELDHEIAKLLAEYSEVTKITSTYGENLIARINPQTGRLHPEFNQLGSGDMEAKKGREKKGTIATGRYSSDFQQLPKPEERYTPVTDEEVNQVRTWFAKELKELPSKKEAVSV